MKIVGVREAQQHLSGLVEQAQKESIVLTRHGRPVAVLRGVGGRRVEDVLIAESAKFWKEIEEARNDTRPSISHEEVKAMFGMKARSTTRRRRRR